MLEKILQQKTFQITHGKRPKEPQREWETEQRQYNNRGEEVDEKTGEFVPFSRTYPIIAHTNNTSKQTKNAVPTVCRERIKWSE